MFLPIMVCNLPTDSSNQRKVILCTKPSKLDVVCEDNNIEHRLTKPATPKTNGMGERVSGTIKNGTILKENYKNKEKMILSLNTFLIHYMLYRRHGGIRKEAKWECKKFCVNGKDL